MLITAVRHCVSEWAYSSGKPYKDPFNDVELDVVFSDAEGREYRVPAFWAGELTWRVRFAPPVEGVYHFHTICSDATNPDLHNQEGTLEVAPYQGNNPLLIHGPLCVSSDRRTLQHRDGTPFFWLADTWWMGLCKRLRYPEDFQELAADRVKKGFTVIQIVAGLYPDMGWMDERGANEAGFPWEEGFTCVNPAYFDMADIRMAHLIRSGLVPCIVGQWGYFMDFAGMEVLKKHWRYIIARWGAYPVIWCAAGEALMDYYLADRSLVGESLAGTPVDIEARRRWQRQNWSNLIHTIRSMDPYRHPITIHPYQWGYIPVADTHDLDICWLSVGHAGYTTCIDTINCLEKTRTLEPKMPILLSESNYEGIMESSREEVQRFMFWATVLDGCAGYSYGANGIWQVNERGKSYGPSPYGMSWGDTPWEEAYKLPGSYQLGLGRKFLERYPWWQFEPHPEWVDPHQTEEDRMSCYAAGIPGKVRMVYFPHNISGILPREKLTIKHLEKGVQYRAFYFNPKTGKEHEFGHMSGDAQGEYIAPKPPSFQDWVLALEAV